ncbi:MAG: acyl-CoA thioesterase [Pontiellaceae bacterium]|jgi:acyl-CoA thioester hydrolase|nr:acyl-CoA thioesterase [Pontiellaceae bacterium]
MKHPVLSHTFQFRVRYSETDQMQTVYNSRVLEWFEVGRTELSRALGIPYAEWERRGIFMPLVEARVFFRGRARYDDLLEMTVTMRAEGRVRLVFENRIVQADGSGPVADGYTVHAMLSMETRKPVRTPDWVLELLNKGL